MCTQITRNTEKILTAIETGVFSYITQLVQVLYCEYKIKVIQ
jgi:hypothetical protein